MTLSGVHPFGRDARPLLSPSLMVMTTTTTYRPRTRSRVANVALWVAQVVAALLFVLAALGKLTGSPQVVRIFDAMGVGAWFPATIAVLELLGAVALFVPRLTGLAGVAFTALSAGAVVTHLLLAPAGVALPVFLLVLSALITWGRWPSITRLWASVPTRGRPRI